MKKFLEKIFRTRGTYNYKLGRENTLLCHIVENTGLRFSPEELDKLLREADNGAAASVLVCAESSLFAPANSSAVGNGEKSEAVKSKTSKPVKISHKYTPHELDDDSALKEFRIKRILEHINVCKDDYEKWIGVDFALFSKDMSCYDWDSWSSTQPEYKPGECSKKWNHFSNRANGMSIGSLYHWATQGGYDEKAVQNEYYKLNPDKRPKDKKLLAQGESAKNFASELEALQAELQEVKNKFRAFHIDSRASIASLKNIETFTAETFLNKEVITAVAFAKIFDSITFMRIKSALTKFNKTNPYDKVSVVEWNSTVKSRVAELKAYMDDLYNFESKIKFKIDSINFISNQKIFLLFRFHLSPAFAKSLTCRIMVSTLQV